MRSLAVLALFAVAACGRTSRVAGAASPSASLLPAGVTPQLIAMGDSLFNGGACVRCHGARGVGGANGPSLVSGPWLHHKGTVDEIAQTITIGVARERLKDSARRFPMNPRGGPMNLSDAQVRAVAAYVWSISRAKS